MKSLSDWVSKFAYLPNLKDHLSPPSPSSQTFDTTGYLGLHCRPKMSNCLGTTIESQGITAQHQHPGSHAGDNAAVGTMCQSRPSSATTRGRGPVPLSVGLAQLFGEPGLGEADMRARRAPKAVVVVYYFCLGAADEQRPVIVRQDGDEELFDVEEGELVTDVACPCSDALGALLSEAGVKGRVESKDILACPRFSGWPYAGQGWQPTPSRLRPLLR